MELSSLAYESGFNLLFPDVRGCFKKSVNTQTVQTTILQYKKKYNQVCRCLKIKIPHITRQTTLRYVKFS